MNKPGEISLPYNASAHVLDTTLDTAPATTSTVSWGAILAGAAAAAALSLILLLLGAGLGLSSVSPWANSGISASTLGTSTIVWLAVTQLLASGLGGYLAGRLRNSWVDVHTDEVYFRDSAHGFLAWAMSALVTASLLGSAVGVLVNGGVQVGSALTKGVASTAMTATLGAAMTRSDSEAEALPYFVDVLFRKDAIPAPVASGSNEDSKSVSPPPTATSATTTAEASRILMNTLRSGSLAADDRHYLGELVAQRTGLDQLTAEKRISTTFTRLQATLAAAEVNARDAADRARSVSAHAALWLFISLLIGAFIASLTATYGGRQRDL